MTVTVYTQPACGSCIATKRHLEKRGIPFTERPVTDAIRMEAQAAGVSSAPIVDTGMELFGGYRPDRLDALAS